jgi:polyhydroxyalkanoate synthesis regulator phasin
MKKRLAAAALSASIVTGAGVGAMLFTPIGATAQTDTTEQTTNPAADRGDPGAWVDDALAGLVDNGTITADQATAVADALDAARPERGPGGHRGGPGLDAAAEALGLTTDALRQQLEAGSTIAEVAQTAGVDPQTVIDAMVADLAAHLDEEVASGEHTQEEADEKMADATERITDMVNNGRPERPADAPAPDAAD